jgi:hypothetical protein
MPRPADPSHPLVSAASESSGGSWPMTSTREVELGLGQLTPATQSDLNLQPSTLKLQPSTFKLQPSTLKLQTSNFKLLPAALTLLDVYEATDCTRLAATADCQTPRKSGFWG